MIKILIIDDSDADAELAILALAQLDEVKVDYVSNLDDFKELFMVGSYTAVISDYNLHGMLGTDLLAYVRQVDPQVPFIIISGALGEERAVEILKQGVTDYVLKDNLKKLPIVLSRAIKEAENARAEKLINQKLVESEEKLRLISQNSPDIVNTIDRNGVITYSNKNFNGFSETEIIGKSMIDFVDDNFRFQYQCHLELAFEGNPQEFVHAKSRYNQKHLWYRIRMTPQHQLGSIDSLLIVSTDITVATETALREEVIGNISSELNKDNTTTSFLEKIRSELGKILVSENFYVGTYDKEKEELTFIFQYIQNKPDPEIPYGRINGNGLSEYVIKTKKSLLLTGDNIVEFQNSNGIYIHMDQTKSWIGVPVMDGDNVFGMVAMLSFIDDKAFDEKDKELLSFVGTQIGAFIRRKEAEQQLKDSQIKWDSLVQNSRDIILTINNKHQITYINQHSITFKQKGLLPEMVIGEEFEMLCSHDQKEEVFKKIENSFTFKGSSSFTMEGGITGNYYDCTVTHLIQEGKRQGLIIIMKDITKLIKAQYDIKESEERYRNVVQDQTEYIIRWKPDGQILFANQSYLDFNESTAEELFKKSYFSLIPKTEKERFQAKISLLTIDNPVLIDSHQSSRGKKGKFWHEWVDRAFFNDKGQVVEYQSVGRDITEQKIAELEIKKSEEFKQSILSALFSSIAVINNKGIIISTNKQWVEFSEKNNGTLIKTGVGANYIDTCNNSIKNGDKIASRALAGIRDVLSFKKEIFELEYPCHSNDVERWFLMRVTPFQGEDGGAVIAHYDISDQKFQQKMIIESENKYRSLFEKMHEGLFVSTEDGIIRMVNPQFASMLGYDESELVGKSGYTFLLSDEDKKRIMPKINDRKMGISESYETKLIKKNGDTIYANFSSSPVYNERDQFDGIMSIVSDISDRKSNEIKLKLSYNEIKNFERISNAVIQGRSLAEISNTILKSLGNFSEIQYSQLYLFEDDQKEINKLGELIDPEVLEKLNSIPELRLNSVNTDIKLTDEFIDIVEKKVPYITSDQNKIKQLLVSYSTNINFKNIDDILKDFLSFRTMGVLPIVSDDSVLGIIVFVSSEIFTNMEVKSISRFSQHVGAALAKKKTEEELREYKENLEKLVTQRTNTLNELNNELEAFNYSVSHDLRTPIRAIDIYRGLLAQELVNTELINYVNQIEKCTHEMNDLIKSLLEFSKMTKAPISIEAVELDQLIRNCFTKQAEFENVANVKLKMEKMPVILADNKLLAIVINNLLSNAIKYSSKQKKPVVEVGYTESEKHYVIYIKDNGVGFNSKLADKLFKPFSRLHHGDQFKGTGAGLAIVDRILKRHNGKIYAESEENKGAVFFFTLPKKYEHIKNEKEVSNS